MCDKLVYDLAQEVEGAPSVFIRKDWINILDNQNQSYVSNQSVLDTSQLSNSNKWMSYREAYFLVPLTITMATVNNPTFTNCAVGTLVPVNSGLFTPATDSTSSDMAIGLKSWYGNIIHSFTLDYNGTTIIQQTPFVNMWNSFKLMTSMSYQDVLTQGTTIGFYPDDAESFEFYPPSIAAVSTLTPPPVGAGTSSVIYIPGNGVCNNSNEVRNSNSRLVSKYNSFNSGLGNRGFYERQKYISFDPLAKAGPGKPSFSYAGTYDSLLSGTTEPFPAIVGQQGINSTLSQLWKSYIIKKQNQTGTAAVQVLPGVIQYAITATIYLKHIHSFFNMIPLLKGVFMKMTMNLNNVSCSITAGVSGLLTAATGQTTMPLKYTVCNNVQSALGGVNMLMVAGNAPANQLMLAAVDTSPTQSPDIQNGAANLNTTTAITGIAAGPTSTAFNKPYTLNLSIGSVCLDNTIVNATGALPGNPCRSIYLYIPAYTFNPTFEQAYLSSPVKQIKYTDIYQYQILKCSPSTPINNLLTNGIANIKSVLILPFYSPTGDLPQVDGVPSFGGVNLSSNTGFTAGYPVYQSPFDPAGCGPTSPLCHLTNFNIQVSGQNAIYNLQKYTFEQFNNQLYGQNAVNGGLTDGITSSMISRQSFDLEYCYYYVNVERMLPVEQSVPKSIQVIGTNMSSKSLDLICFIEYGTEVSIDALTGSRV